MLGTPVPAKHDLDARVMGAALTRRMFGAENDTPIRIGRFVVLDRIGGGGMGTVFRAYDPELDRRVAVKVLRLDIARDDPSAARRMQHEAVALARLAHPNVVTVHEVGTIDAQTFLAMEYVAGVDLAQWMRAHAPGGTARFAEAMDLLQQAGRGLAAAHSAGLVHRDFKPSNVLVGDDGRVRVADFGLVRTVDEQQPTIETTTPTGIDRNSALSRVTQAGALVGTLRYMAPEQQRGAGVDAKSDQFSFCVAAWEVLFGHLPWAEGVSDDAPEIPKDAPRWIVAVLARGLAIDPHDRHPDMAALLTALGRDPRRRRRVLALGLGTLAALGGAAATLAHHRATMCDDGPAALARTWHEDRRAALAQRFAALEVDGAEEAWSRSDARLRAFADEWLVTRDAVCDAGRRRHELPEATFDAAMGCLDIRLVDLEATLSVLETGGLRAAVNASSLAFALRMPGACARGHASEAMRLPDDPQRADDVLRVARALAAARLAGETGDWSAALTSVEALQPDIAALDHLPLTLRADELHWIALTPSGYPDRAEAIALAAYWNALRHGEDAMAAAFARRLAQAETNADDPNAAQRWIEHARVLGERAEIDDGERAMLEVMTARLATNHGDLDEAQRVLERAAELGEAHWGPDHPEMSSVYTGLATVLRRKSEFAAATRISRKILAINEAALGPDAPATLISVAGLAASLSREGMHDEALALNRRVVASRQRWYGSDHINVAAALADLGVSAMFAGRPTDAVDALRQAATLHARLPADSEKRLLTEHNFAQALADTGGAAEAVAIERNVLAQFERGRGPDHPRVAMALWGLGGALALYGELDEAEQVLERALAIFVRKLGEDHGDTIGVRLELLQIALARDQAQHVLDTLDDLLPATTDTNLANERGKAYALQARAFAALGRIHEANVGSITALALLHNPHERLEVLHRMAAH